MMNYFDSLKSRKGTDNESGFTLIELMIVVVIIGILAAIAIPIFANQQREAIRAGMKSDVKNLNTVVQTYLITNPTATNLQWRLQGGAPDASLSALEDDPNWRKVSASLQPSASETILIIRQTALGNNIGTWDDYVVLAANRNASTNASYYYAVFTSTTGKLTEINS